MRPSVPRLVRILPRHAVDKSGPIPALLVSGLHRSDAKKPTLIELLQKRQQEAGADFPSNIRIEPIVPKQAFKNISPEVRTSLKRLMKEK